MQLQVLTTLALASSAIAAPAILPQQEQEDIEQRDAVGKAPYALTNGGSVPGVFPGIRPLANGAPKASPKGRGPQADRATHNGLAAYFGSWKNWDSGLQDAAETWQNVMGPFRLKHAPFPGVPITMPVLSKREDEESASVVKRDIVEDDVYGDDYEEVKTTMIEKYLPPRPWSRTTLQEEREGLAQWLAGEVSLKKVKHGGIFEGF